MHPELAIALASCIDGYSSRRAQGQTLTEDEVLLYNQLCNTMRRWTRYLECNYEQAIREFEEKNKEDDDDNSSGNPAKIAPSPS
jgi:hypothetical protein